MANNHKVSSSFAVSILYKDSIRDATNCIKTILHVDTGFSRGSAAFEVRVRIDENCLFGIQIQNGCYRRLLQTTQDKQNKDLFKDKSSKIFDNNESWQDSEIWEEVLYPTKKSGAQKKDLLNREHKHTKRTHC